ncbi:hypothetical protein A2531_02090 [Candidatus Falkowbacteria bacterium RIFOXYD2_FULL_34_120]|uniref:UDP-N-acetylglucosamine kinase n=1 Tax=Candidatus Falkowbacteria bacterium RIFOXYD2_FULL_34_120 TaxID=1798007 RepID=A0A1F5TMB1_9BACT|nr:MAG: hypothetical protein A2466_06500 [Candidatus Falkowbacteria bacterium RIFOXYC2_FULL_34_220]OGF38760.1 MAG: hypothetical protein A2515_01835 [Candidatus Falkowbacteria bacterium RIFOXYD12_FULL_34_57]OGF39994.1 MAG: hypothetical protein A2531_02090 [Candidatus Falkowbacteria bacterium RIFOXYD2_FULL_34_120]
MNNNYFLFLNSMRKTVLIIISGPPATGKTSAGYLISKKFNLPFVCLDEIKEKLFDEVGFKIGDKKWDKKLSDASINIMYYISNNMLKVGASHILEGVLVSSKHIKQLKNQLKKHNPIILQIQMSADKDIIKKRYQERSDSKDRHPGHFDDEFIAELKGTRKIKEKLNFLDIKSKKFSIDTSEININTYTETFKAIKTCLKIKK